MDMLGDDAVERERRNIRRVITVGGYIWIVVGLLSLAATGWRWWNEADQRQRAIAFVEEHKALDRKQHKAADRELARFRRWLDAKGAR